MFFWCYAKIGLVNGLWKVDTQHNYEDTSKVFNIVNKNVRRSKKYSIFKKIIDNWFRLKLHFLYFIGSKTFFSRNSKK